MTTHCSVLWLTPRSRWIEGKATFTMATSRTTMNCAAQVSARIMFLAPVRAVVTMSPPHSGAFQDDERGSPNRHPDCFRTAALLLTRNLVKVKGTGHTGDVTRGYGQFCGLARALDLVGGRWALLVVRDLLTGPKRFTELQEGLHGIPTNVLTSRLRELEEVGIVERRVRAHPGGGVDYALTEYGLELEEPVLQLGFWGAKALGPPEKDDFISVDSLALALRGAFRPEKARGPKRLYEVRIDGKPLRIGVKGGKVAVPAVSPGEPVEPDVVVETAPGVMSELLTGAVDVDAAIDSGRVQLDGDRVEARRLFEMFR